MEHDKKSNTKIWTQKICEPTFWRIEMYLILYDIIWLHCERHLIVIDSSRWKYISFWGFEGWHSADLGLTDLVISHITRGIKPPAAVVARLTCLVPSLRNEKNSPNRYKFYSKAWMKKTGWPGYQWILALCWEPIISPSKNQDRIGISHITGKQSHIIGNRDQQPQTHANHKNASHQQPIACLKTVMVQSIILGTTSCTVGSNTSEESDANQRPLLVP